MCMPPFCRIGSDGCESTGARTAGSSIIDSAKLPVKHMPIAPTPRPPHSGKACAASARSQSTIGLDSLAAKARNSAADAAAHHAAQAVERRRRPPVVAEEVRHPDGEAGVAHPAREARHLRVNAGHLGHDDHRGPAAHDVHPSGLVEKREVAALEVAERIEREEIGLGHARVLSTAPATRPPAPPGGRTGDAGDPPVSALGQVRSAGSAPARACVPPPFRATC